MSLFLIAALPFLGAFFPGLLIRAGRNTSAASAGLASFLAFVGLMLHAPAILKGETVQARVDWLPQLGLSVNFYLDGLSFLFAALILGIGILVIIYARFYLSRNDPMGNFYTYLLLFQGAMVGIVTSDNILMLLIFWELTSLSSFLLIGFWKHLPEGRQGARMALTVTGMGGLSMIAGMLILGQISGSYDISVILDNKDAIQSSELYLPALILILIGAFTKSAQFPFHFWLPHAMAAPTPVSSYLHSATMVKAGIFLMARLWPVLSGTPEWFYIVTTTGLITMLIGAIVALFKDDLKAMLAFSTVSHLGLITMLLGLGTKAAAVAAVFHILNHATFKAALFMTAGIVDHEAHTRDIRRLGGLRQLMPLSFTIALIAGLSMAGIPPFNGFISKEMMLEAAIHSTWMGNPYIIPSLATLAAVFSVAYSLRFIGHTFMGPLRTDYVGIPHDPPAGLWLSPAILTVLVVVIGLFSGPIAGPIVQAAADAVTGSHPKVYLKLWHGLNPALYMSIAAVAIGAILIAVFTPVSKRWRVANVPAAKSIFDAITGFIIAVSRFIADRLHDGSITRYAAIMISFTIIMSLIAFQSGGMMPPTREIQDTGLLTIVGWACLVAATLGIVVMHQQRFFALILIGIVGLMVSLGFNYLSAPDLALTQISVEVVTIILMLLALNFLPKNMPSETNLATRLRDITIAVAGGFGVGALVYALLLRDFSAPSISEFHLANSYKGGGGTNVVNVILVDFRGFDTFGEIIVLGIAALVIYALTEAVLKSNARAYLLNRKPYQQQAGDAHPGMMVVVTRVMMPVALMLAAYIFFRGHNLPGGGFIAGLIAAIALIMQYMASGFGWASERQPFAYHGTIGWGVLIAAATGLGAWFNDVPFLTSDFGYFKLPFLEEFELATAALFDVGVFLAVVGAVLLALKSLARFAWQPGIHSEHAIDINPARDDCAADEKER